MCLVHARVFEHFVEMHIKQPGGVFRPLDVPADPEKRLGDPTQHPGLLIAGLVLAGTAIGCGAAYRLRGKRRRPVAFRVPDR